MTERIGRLMVSTQKALRDDSGQAMTEYALVLTLLVAGIVLAMGVLTGDIRSWIDGITSTFP
jgi:Flp pilus assembly pilin Flp